MVARRILQSDAILVAASSYIERRGAPETLQDLIDHDCIHTRRDEEPLRVGLYGVLINPMTLRLIEVEPVLIANHTIRY